jgi:filamentous hemagglutinin
MLDLGMRMANLKRLAGPVRLLCALAAMLASGPLAAAPPANQLPIVCVAGNCGPNGPSTWLGSGQATASTAANTLTIQQSSEQAVLNWASFNVGADGKVIFKQPNSSAIALNQIFQASPSQIFGLVKANGQIYLVNQNGFVFGSTSQVNVAGLLATSLQLTDPLGAGLLAALQQQEPALANPLLGPDGQPLPVAITVQQGAELTATDNGRIMLASQTVTNGGSISAPDGQVILAAGQSVFIEASSNPDLRGLIVQVDSGGLAQNLSTGSISVAEGNVSLVGLAVNQQGRISATTSVSENGSIELLAEDSVAVQTSQTGVLELVPQQGGTLTLGPQSVTEVLPDSASSATAVDAQVQPQSQITLAGEQVELTGGSHVIAPGGAVAVTASADPGVVNSSATPDPNAQLRIDAGATIDVAGSVAKVPVTRNLIAVQLRGTELADDPLQRNGALRGQTVIVDATVGTPLANISGELALIPRGVLERTDQGGSITLDSAGDVVVAKGATLNVTGGAVDYTPGIMQTSELIESDGATVNIANASPNQIYLGVVNPTYQLVNNNFGVIQEIPTPGIAQYNPGYVQGANAGSIQVLGSSLVLEGTFLGQAINGIYQRSGPGVASGGTFALGLSTPSNPAAPDYRAPAVELVNQAPNVVVAPGAPLPSDLPVELSTSLLTQGGFTNLQIASNDRITIPSGVAVDIGPGGSLTLEAPQIDVDGSVRIPSGTIQMTSVESYSSGFGTPSLGIFVGNGASFNVGGTWTNDTLLPASVTPTGLALVNGGSIELDQGVIGGTLSLGSDDQFLANGGGQLARGATLTGGTGGSIALIASPGSGTVTVGNGDTISGLGVQGAAGGTFSLEVPRLEIDPAGSPWLAAQTVSSNPGSPGFFQVGASLFSGFGFASFNLTANGPQQTSGDTADILKVMPGTSINLSPLTVMLDPGEYQNAASGTPLSAFSTEAVLPAYERGSEQLTLQALSSGAGVTSSNIGDLTFASGAGITADPGSSFTFASEGNLNFDGVLSSPSAAVTLENVSPPAGLAAPPTVQLALDSTARIDVAGTVIYQPDNTGLLQGTVLPGGCVSLTAFAGSVHTSPGSVIDFSGTQAPLDLPSGVGETATTRAVVASAAGTLSIAAPESISLLGSYLGKPGVGTTGRAAGGTLEVALLPQPGEASTLTVQPELPGAAMPPGSDAVASIEQLLASGVDALTLESPGVVEFTDGAQLELARSVTITAPAIEVNSQQPITVTAPYIALGAASTGYGPVPASPGTGVISFSGSEVDLIGALAFQQVSLAKLISSGEIQLRGELVDDNNLGSLDIAGELILSAARVVPTTAVNFTITASGGQNNSVEFEQNGSLRGVPLSVGGSLTVNADDILQGGTVFAPFGQLTFAANDTLTFAPGSLTSVSGSSTVLPYGEVQNGTSWVYQVSPSELVPATVTAIPNREVSASGAKVTLASGATIDVSGGGDLDAYEFTPGTGGTVDVLANNVSPGLYAILPSLEGQTAPYDPMMWQGSNIAPNESVHLSGGGGLAAGVYPLLPARYGLLPGAFLIQVASGYGDLTPGTAANAPNGYPIVSGYFTYGNTSIGDTRTSGFLIEPGSYSEQLADYTPNLASTFFAPTTGTTPQQPAPGVSPLPADAGTLVVSVQNEFDALGTVKGGGGAGGGEGATVEIAAPAIEIDPSLAGSSTTPGQIHLPASVLDSWDAGRLWLGAEVGPDGSGSPNPGSVTVTTSPVTVTASSVEVTSGSALSADEIVLAATGNVQIDPGASVTTTSMSSATMTPLAASATPSTLSLSGSSSEASVLIASDLNDWQVSRGTGAGGSAGTLEVASGARVASRGSLTVDAPGGGTLGDGALSGAGAQWAIGSTDLAFAPQGTVSGGFALDDSLIAVLSKAGSITLSSQNAIGIAQPVNLAAAAGEPVIGQIEIVAPGLTNTAGAAGSSFAAGIITLAGSAPGTAVTEDGSGTLSFTAREIDIGPATLALSGFGSTTLDASNVIAGMGSGSVTTAGNLALLTSVLTADGDSQAQIAAAGSLTLAPSSHPAVGAPPILQVGGSLELTGNSVSDSTVIDMPSGEVAVNAAQQLTLESGAIVKVAGVMPANAPYGSDGGTIALNSGGNLSVAPTASLSVAAGSGANAGSISVTATGTADIEGQLEGSSGAGMRSGSFTLVAGSLTNFTGLNDVLEQSGFHDTRSIEVGTGDLDLAAGSSITALNVVLTADSGNVVIGGTIDASSAAGGGSIVLSASNELAVSSGGQLRANGTGAAAGGTIELASTMGSVQIDPATDIEATGAAGSGTLLVRAPQSSTGNDVNILSLPASLTAIGTVVLEPMISETLAAAPTASQFQSIESSVASFMSTAGPTMLAGLGVAGTPNVVVRPYVDMTASGDLTLPGVDFSTWRFNGQPADISIRSTGNLTVAGTLSDGFSTSSGFLDVLPDGDSARISLVAGANLDSASATAVVTGAAADLDLGPGAIVRTGTGALELTAAEDVIFGAEASVYTGGVQGAPSNPSTSTHVPLSFPTNGGDITITAGRDVVGAPLTEAVDQWDPRLFPSGTTAAIWGIDFGQFHWNVGALGGGDVSIDAGRNAIDLTAAVADSRTFAPDGVTSLGLGGGDLAVTTGGDLGSGLFYVGNGAGRINAGGALTSTLTGTAGLPLGTMLLAGDASYYVSAQRDVLLESELSETALTPGTSSNRVLFFRDDPDSTLWVESRGGSITYQSNSANEQTFLGIPAAFHSDPGVFSTGPPTLELASFAGNVNLGGSIQTLPSTTGQLSVYAAQDIEGNGESLGMSDAPLSSVPTADAPSQLTTVAPFFGGTSYTVASLHQNDPQPVLISAGQDIDNIGLYLPKPADVTAGGNITSLGFAGQNLNPDQTTVIRAGGNIDYLSTDTTQSLTLTGPGQFDIIAGGNVDLGLTAGIATYGNLLNPNLASSTGAAVTVIAGLGAPIGVGGAASPNDFVGKVIGGSAGYQDMLVSYIEQLTGDTGLTFASAAPLFRNLPLTEQLPLIESVFFDQLVLAGEQANEVPSLGFGTGYAAVDSLFPGSRGNDSPYSGNLSLGFSRIYTLDGGSINLLVPGGSINVGLANPPLTFTEYHIVRTPSQLGIVAVGTGDVNVYTYDSIEVNQSRVFTLGGGAINIWSTTGNIDAGNGAKTSISAPPPSIEVSANGVVTLNFSEAIAGSGIRTIQSLPGVPAGNVNLIAPVGFVNSGDAGIGSSGDINIAAQKVIGAANINFSGTATGIPPAVGNLGVSLSGAASASSSATSASATSVESGSSASAPAPLASAALGWLDVFVEGFGEEVCKATDLECLKRNQKSQ